MSGTSGNHPPRVFWLMLENEVACTALPRKGVFIPGMVDFCPLKDLLLLLITDRHPGKADFGVLFIYSGGNVLNLK